MSIPSGYKGPVTFFWWTEYGGSLCAVAGDDKHMPGAYIPLGTIDVDVTFDTAKITDKAVECFRKQINREKAESVLRVRALEGKIQSLLAIEHKEPA